MTTAIVKVVGMVAGQRQHVVAQVVEGDPVLLLPEPGNPHDPNTVAVHTAPAGVMSADSTFRDGRWTHLALTDRRLLEDRQAGYLPAGLARRVRLPSLGLPGTVHTVRYHPDTGVPAGFDVLANLPL